MSARVVAYVPDLMDRSKVAAGRDDVSFVSSADALLAALAGPGVEVVVVDLDRFRRRDRLVEVVAAAGSARLVAYGSHVDRDSLAEARAAGIDDVRARSAFFPLLGTDRSPLDRPPLDIPPG